MTERRPWGPGEARCPHRSTDPAQYAQCGLIPDHPGPCVYSVRPCQIRTMAAAYWPECRLAHGHPAPCLYRTLADIDEIRRVAGYPPLPRRYVVAERRRYR